ncbi:MAG: CoA-binding protein [Promethearchaeota archaeon]
MRKNIEFERLFNPRAIAVIGVSIKGRGGSFFVHILKENKFPNPVYPINSKYEGQDLFGYRIYGSIDSLPDTAIDLAIVAVPAKFTPKVIEELGKKGVKFAHIFSSGFSEVGNGHLEKELLKNVKKYGIRIVGPNCMGIFSPKAKISSFRNTLLESGSVAFISQSGGHAGHLIGISPSRNIGFSKVISLGNQIDLDLLDFLDYFRSDPETKIIVLYVENLKKDGNKFVHLLKSVTLEKPVIIWKGGISESGNKAVMSHTGGLAGDFKIWQAMAKQTGVILVNGFEEVIELLQAFLNYPIPKTTGTAIITAGGGYGVEATDACEKNGLTVPEISREIQKKFSEFIPNVNTSIKNPLDLGGTGFRVEALIKMIDILNEEPNISIVEIVSSPELYQIYGGTNIETVVKGFGKALNNENKIMINIPTVQRDNKESLLLGYNFRSMLRNYGIVPFRSMNSAAKALFQLYNYGQYLNKYENKYEKILK